jgi:hypothetical protein
MSPYTVSLNPAVNLQQHDAFCIVYDKLSSAVGTLSHSSFAPVATLVDTLNAHAALDHAFQHSVQLVPFKFDGTQQTRVVLSPLGSLTQDTDDVRVFGEAAEVAIKRALKAGAKTPLVILATEPVSSLQLASGDDRYQHALEVAMLGALRALYVPFQHRDFCQRSGKPDPQPVRHISFFSNDQKYADQATRDKLVKYVEATNAGLVLGKGCLCLNNI